MFKKFEKVAKKLKSKYSADNLKCQNLILQTLRQKENHRCYGDEIDFNSLNLKSPKVIGIAFRELLGHKEIKRLMKMRTSTLSRQNGRWVFLYELV